jgi:hypothetical protein
MAAKQSAVYGTVAKPVQVPKDKDFVGTHKKTPQDSKQPKDNFATKESIKTTIAKVPAVAAKSLTPGVPVKDTPWEASGQGHKPSVRTFAGSTTSRGGKIAKASK